MTEEDKKATAADALVEYSEIQKEIACLRKRIEPFAEGFKALGAELSRTPERVGGQQSDKAFRFTWREEFGRGQRSSPTTYEFDPAELVQLLMELGVATERIGRLKQALHGMGHGHMVKD